MTSVAIIPVAGKPIHAGHYGLIMMASRENDRVELFVSTSDRDNVSGKAMKIVWDEQLEPSLPDNVNVTYGGAPVANAYALLGKASEEGSNDEFFIYSDPDDAARFNDESLQRYAPNVIVHRKPVERTSTVDVSGTKMRAFLASGDKESFLRFMPKEIDGEQVWETLLSMPPEAKVPKKRASKKSKETLTGEGLLRRYVNMLVSGR
jgi:hypothetical protein